MAEPFVVTIILNTNRRDDTLACLDSLMHNSYKNHSVIVLDNNSTDGSVETIRAKYPGVEIVAIQQNLGYAGNNNVGIRMALEKGSDWVFVINEDTVLDEACLDQLVKAAESDPRIGIAGPMVYHFDEPEYIQSAGGKLGPYWQSNHISKNELDSGQWKEPHNVEWISGCAILVKRAVIERVGMIDERFFYYWEETEWCLRTGEAGWRILHVPSAKIWHKGVQRNYEPKPALMYYSTRNRLLMFSKHRAPLIAWLKAWTEILRTLFSWSLRPKWRSRRAHRDMMWKGAVDFLRGRWGRLEG